MNHILLCVHLNNEKIMLGKLNVMRDYLNISICSEVENYDIFKKNKILI